MCFHLSGFICPGCARQFAPTFQRCPGLGAPSHYISSLSLIDLIRSNSYYCPTIGCELNGNIHHCIFNLQVDAALQNESFLQAGFPLLPHKAYSISAQDDEPCETARSESKVGANEHCELALSDTEGPVVAPRHRNKGRGRAKKVKSATEVTVPLKGAMSHASKVKDRAKKVKFAAQVRVYGPRSHALKPLRDGSGRVRKANSVHYRPSKAGERI